MYGKWMYEREDIAALVQLIEHGILDLSNVEVIGEYALSHLVLNGDQCTDQNQIPARAVARGMGQCSRE